MRPRANVRSWAQAFLLMLRFWIEGRFVSLGYCRFVVGQERDGLARILGGRKG